MRPPRLLAVTVFLLALACTEPTRDPDDYYVVQSYDARAVQWTVVHRATWDGQRQRRRYVLECTASENAQGEKVSGRGACSLPVGARLASDVDQLYAVTHPNEKFWWASDRRQPLFVIDMTNVDLLTVAENDKNIGGKQISVNYFRVVRADVEMEK